MYSQKYLFFSRDINEWTAQLNYLTMRICAYTIGVRVQCKDLLPLAQNNNNNIRILQILLFRQVWSIIWYLVQNYKHMYYRKSKYIIYIEILNKNDTHIILINQY